MTSPASTSRAGEADAREAARGGEPLMLGPALPAPQLERRHRLGDEPKELRLAGQRVPHRRQSLEIELAGRDRDAGLAQVRAGQQVAGLDIRPGIHREEQLAIREPEDRLMAAEEVEVRGLAHDVGTMPRRAVRTSRWLR